MEKAAVAEMLEEVDKIWIYPEYMEIAFGWPGLAEAENMDVKTVEYGNLFDYRKKKRDEREDIVELMREDPKITAKRIAGRLGLSLSGVNYRIRVLKKEGRVRFRGKGGKGEWEISE